LATLLRRYGHNADRVIPHTTESRGSLLGTARVQFVVVTTTLGQTSLPVLQFPATSIIPSLLHIHSRTMWRLDKGAVSGPSSTETDPHTVTITKGLIVKLVMNRSQHFLVLCVPV
jgi:hypothetical protein